MISVSTTTQNSAGCVTFDEDQKNTKIQYATARISRVKTLDGGVVITHSGMSDGDRTLNIQATLTETAADKLWDIFYTETTVYLSTKHGFFSGMIQSLNILPSGKMTMNYYVKEKLA